MVALQRTGYLLVPGPCDYEDKWYNGNFIILSRPPKTNLLCLEVLYEDVIERDGPILTVEKIKVLGYVRSAFEI